MWRIAKGAYEMKEPGAIPNPTDTLTAWCRLVEHAPVAMAVTLGETHTLHCLSPAFAQLLDAAPLELQGRCVADALAVANADEVVALLDRVFATGAAEVSAVFHHVHPHRGPDSYHWVVWRIGLGDGSPMGLALQVQDVTPHEQRHNTDEALAEHLREVNERLVLAGLREQAARAEAEAALAVRDQFLAIASHELKTPLTSLIGYTYMLQQTASTVMQSDEIFGRAVTLITNQANRLNSMIDQLLDVSRISKGQLRIERRPLDLGALVTRVVAGIRITLKQHTMSLTIPDEPVLVLGDDLRLEQVVQNLLSNAVKYSPAGGPVLVSLVRSGSEALLEVTDKGIGIPADAQMHLFDSFFRAPNAGHHTSGFGIGLYVVKEIVTQHGGRIEVDSTEGQGSTFRVALPIHVETTA
ncbi:MAG: hypothetical protein CYG59_12855 [Chloroflexi bacterium]|nr:MAG: hypothetical protein CYG59_12855 [Chloroflexota bacterium]